MVDFLDDILRRIGRSIGVIGAEDFQLKALIGTPHNVRAVRIKSLREFLDYSRTTEWFTLEIIDPILDIEGEEDFRAGSITILMHHADGKWEHEWCISDFENDEAETDYELRWGRVARLLLRLLELLHLVHWIASLLLDN